jgi:methylmalonyl-CoA mutase, C-terminal domain
MRQRAAETATRPDHPRNGSDGAKRKKAPTTTVDKSGRMRKIRILVAKPGLDGHDRGVLVLARYFRDAGMEVIYIGLLPTPEEVARMAVDEDVDVVALSLLNGAHMTAFPQVKRLLDKFGGKDIIVIGGGIIPDEDKPKLLKLGISGLYGPGTSLEEIISHIEGRVRKERWGAAAGEKAVAEEKGDE